MPTNIYDIATPAPYNCVPLDHTFNPGVSTCHPVTSPTVYVLTSGASGDPVYVHVQLMASQCTDVTAVMFSTEEIVAQFNCIDPSVGKL